MVSAMLDSGCILAAATYFTSSIIQFSSGNIVGGCCELSIAILFAGAPIVRREVESEKTQS